MAVGTENIKATVSKTQFMSVFIKGIPYGKPKLTGDRDAAKRWTDAIVRQTRRQRKIREACAMNVTFLLPAERYLVNSRYANDLDNLLKRFFDALKDTIFSEAPGEDACVVVLHAMKTPVPTGKEAGASLEILPISV
jgi:Holliday junction resolvase RusA-like endonuclease